MILYILKNKTFVAYILFAIFCVIFRLVYYHYSHNVYSVYITWLFVVPILGGMVSFFIKNVFFHCAMVTFSVSMAIKGVLEIAGTTSKYRFILTLVAVLLAIVSVAYEITVRIKNEKNNYT